jgi:hypothetical protein
MFKRFINVRYVLVICSLAVFVAFPAQTSKADAASCTGGGGSCTSSS